MSLAFALNHAIGGVSLPGYHAVNIALHLACAVLFFRILEWILRTPRLAASFGSRAADLSFAAALLWVVHPLASEPVDYLVERTESMMALCLLLTLYASLRASRAHGWRWGLLAVLACAAGMACKETMVVAPLLVVLCDSLFVFDSIRQALRRRWALYLGLAATWSVLFALVSTGPRSHSAGFASGVTPWAYLLNQCVMLRHYLRLVVWPHPLVLWYGTPAALALRDVWPAAVVIIVSLAASGWALLRRRPAGFAGAWVFLTLAPTSSVVPIATEVGAERRMYLPLMAFIALAVLGTVWIVDRVRYLSISGPKVDRQRAAVAWAVVVCLAAPLGVTTIVRNREYRSALGMAWTVLNRWPTGSAHFMVGGQLELLGRHDEATAHYRQAVDAFPRAQFYLARELARAGHIDEAIQQYRMFIDRAPALLEVIEARLAIGQGLTSEGHWQEGLTEFRQVLAMTPANLDAMALLASALGHERTFDEAFWWYRRYLAARPADVSVLNDFGVALSQSEQHDQEAVAVFQRATVLQPGNAALELNLGRAEFLIDDLTDAIAATRQAIVLDPTVAAAHDLLARELGKQGLTEDARRELVEALRLDPADAEARAMLDHLTQVAPMGR